MTGSARYIDSIPYADYIDVVNKKAFRLEQKQMR